MKVHNFDIRRQLEHVENEMNRMNQTKEKFFSNVHKWFFTIFLLIYVPQEQSVTYILNDFLQTCSCFFLFLKNAMNLCTRSLNASIIVKILWEGHKIWKNSDLFWHLHQNMGEISKKIFDLFKNPDLPLTVPNVKCEVNEVLLSRILQN